jgi:flavorubredoxin
MIAKVAENVYWVGAVDWNVRNFHGYTYTTARGTTYNAYLIMDEKIALVDTVLPSFTETLLDHIKQLVDPAKIDYLIANHAEVDHSGAIPAVLALAKNAKLVCSPRGKTSLSRFYGERFDYVTVKTGEELKLGKKTLSFIEAPMLHWPDSMFTYVKEDKLLLPNDAFGQHIASSERFDDEIDEFILMDEAAKYYANILLPLSSYVTKKLEEVTRIGIEIKTIAPSHGIIWREDPAKIIKAYAAWASGASSPEVLVVYETMWGNTEKTARAVLDGLIKGGVKAQLYALPNNDRTEVIKDLLGARGIIVGSSTHNEGILLNIAAFLEDVKGLKPIKKIASSFGTYGWSPIQAKNILAEKLKATGMEVVESELFFKWTPDENELSKAFEFGRIFAAKVK